MSALQRSVSSEEAGRELLVRLRDLSFVHGVTRSADDRRVIRGIIGIAREFGLLTIAEGVEDESTLDLLRELGADLVQGYLLGRPAPLSASVA